MKYLNPALITLLVITLAGCGGTEDAVSSNDAITQMAGDRAGQMMDHGEHAMEESIGHATGVIRSVGEQGNTLTIDHGPFTGGIEMAAMTMRYGVTEGMDISAFTENAEVAFLVKHDRDGSYRILAICNTRTDGVDCLDDKRDP